MTIGNAVFQGIVQGLTEFLPVSSSGHLSLVQYFTGYGGESGALFTVLLHMGTLLAVFLAFYKTILGLIVETALLLADLLRGRFLLANPTPRRRLLLLLIVSLLPMAITVALRERFTSLAADNSILVEGLCFLLTSLLLFLSVKCVKGHKNATTMNWNDAAAVGVMQAIAPLPGLSRSGSTISLGLMLGLEREFAVAFSFIMGIPAVLGANILELGDAMERGLELPIPALAAGVAASLAFGLLAIKMVRWLVVSDKFKIFAWYTLVLGVIVTGIGVYESFSGHALQQAVIAALGQG